jgi:hypothetical protein
MATSGAGHLFLACPMACPRSYLIPRGSDPAYLAGDSDMEDPDADPMEAAVRACPRRFQDIRALPTPAGGAVFFTHRVIHWGSAARAVRACVHGSPATLPRLHRGHTCPCPCPCCWLHASTRLA